MMPLQFDILFIYWVINMDSLLCNITDIFQNYNEIQLVHYPAQKTINKIILTVNIA